MTAKETVLSLYRAYSSGDPAAMEKLLHEDVIWVAPPGNATQVALGLGEPGDAGRPNGSNNLNRDEIIDFMTRAYPRFFRDADNRFHRIVAEDDTVFVEHRLSARLPDGRPYVNDYCFAYEVCDGRVVAIREYMDTRGGWVQVFGSGEPRRMIEYVTR